MNAAVRSLPPRWLAAYRHEWLPRDLAAGLATAAVVVPQSVAHASLAGLPVQIGLYTAFAPMLLYALLGTSRPLSVSTTSTIAVLTAAALAGAGVSADPSAAALLALLTGMVLLAAGVLRLGFVADFLSVPILAGFRVAMGLVIVSSQLGKLLGLSLSEDGVLGTFASAVVRLPEAHPPTVALSALSLALLFGLRHWLPRVSAPLAVVALGVAAARFGGLDVAVVGEVPAGLPPLRPPSLALARALLPAAAAIGLMSFVESTAASRALVVRGDLRPDPDRDLIALGTANLAGSLTSAFPAGGGLSQSAVNDRAGARTQLAAVTTALTVALTLLLLTPVLADLPQATLGALVLVAAISLVDPKPLRRIGLLRRRGLVLALVASSGVLFLGILAGLLMAALVSVLLVLHELNHPAVPELGRLPNGGFADLAQHPDATTLRGLVILRPRGGLYYANVQRVRARMVEAVERAAPGVRVVLLDAVAVSDLEITALDALHDLAADLRQDGVELWVADVPAPVAELLLRAQADAAVFPNVDEAVAAYRIRSSGRPHSPRGGESGGASGADTGLMSQAWSADGSVFGYELPLDAGLAVGGFAEVVTDDGVPHLGQVLSGEVALRHGPDGAYLRAVAGDGFLLDGPVAAFGHARIGPAAAPLLERRPAAARQGEAELNIGGLRDAAEIPATLRAAGFNRHTFLCGQSGSGKTYALGLLLEQLVLRTRLPLLVLDPNGDYAHLGETRPEVDAPTADRYRRAVRGTEVRRAAGEDGEALRIRFRDLGTDGQAAVLQLDPLRDREEYNEFLHLAESGGWASYAEVLEALSATPSGTGAALRMRLENLRVGTMAVWAGASGRSVVDRWSEDRPRALVADLSGFAERRERLAVALAVLQGLWARRARREPCLVVVDEAHDLCPAAPADELQERVLDLFIRVAGEGRKYGIHLLLATQRPAKLHANVLSQCDNVVLLRVNSAADRAQLQEQFSFAPAGLVELAGRFRQGEALVAGPITPFPLLARFGRRLTPEGGGDVPTDWAR